MRRFSFVFGAVAFCAGAAFAQESGLIIDENRPDRQAPGADLEIEAQPSAPAQTVAPRPGVPAFVLRSVRVEGSSLQPALIEEAARPLIGRSFDGESLSHIANAIAALYARSDVALYGVDIPDQDFSTGEVRLRAREGHVGAVSITGETEGNIDLVRHYAAGLAAERPLSRPTMERQLSLISDIPGLETSVGMSAADARGAVRLQLGLNQRPWAYEVGLDSRGSEALGEHRIVGSLTRNGLFRLGDQTRLSLGADVEFQHFGYAALSHRQPIGHSGAVVTGSVSTLRTEPDDGLRGRAETASLVVSYPAIRSYTRNLTLSAGIDGLDSDNAVLGDVVAEERVRVARASAAFVEASQRSAWVLGATLSQGLDGMDAYASSASTALDFTKVNLQFSHNRALGEAFYLRVNGAGQASGSPLPASERFTLGGASFGRGFAAAQTSGDDGFGLSGELAWRAEYGWLSELYVFGDGGRVWTEDRPGLPGVMRDIASAGAGMRLKLGDEGRLDLELARPIDAATPSADTDDWRFNFGVSAKL